MKNVQIVISWLATIVLGSMVLSILIALFDKHLDVDSFFGILILASIFATALSIPAVVLFVIFNNRYSKNIQDKKVYKKKMMLLQLGVGAVYFLISLLFIFIMGFDEESLYVLLALLFSYLPAGLIIWYFNLSKESKMFTDDIIDI